MIDLLKKYIDKIPDKAVYIILILLLVGMTIPGMVHIIVNEFELFKELQLSKLFILIIMCEFVPITFILTASYIYTKNIQMAQK